jgi:hypothetical protein
MTSPFIPTILLCCMAVSTSCDPKDASSDTWEWHGPGQDAVSSDTQSTNPLLDRLVKASKACGSPSRGTVPIGWQQVQVTVNACTQWCPADWVILGKQDEILLARDGTRKTVGYVSVVQLAGTQWPLPQILNLGLESLQKTYRSPKPEVLHYEEDQVLGIPMAGAVFTFQVDGTPVLGTVRVVSSCSATLNACSVTLMGFWQPYPDIELTTCTLMQIDASTRCPSGASGNCSTLECQQWCQGKGYYTGECVGEECRCY